MYSIFNNYHYQDKNFAREAVDFLIISPAQKITRIALD